MGIKDEYAGERIKDTADKTGVVISIAALVLGFLIWSRLQDTAGALIGIIIVGVGLFAAFVITSVMYSYGDMITISIEQTRILKRLEARKLSDLIAEKTAVSQYGSAADIQTAKSSAAADVGDGPEDAVSAADSEEAQETPGNKTTAAGTAVYVDRNNRIAQFSERLEAGVICPICGRQQSPSADACFFCGCVFVYDQDTSAQRDKVQANRPVRQP